MYNEQQSFEESLRQSQLPQNQNKKKKKNSSKVQMTNDEIQIFEFFQPKPIQKQFEKVAKGELDFIFNGARDANLAKPYTEDGDENMQELQNQKWYSQENITKRRKLKSDPDVVEAIDKFISHYDIEDDKLIKDQYLKVHVRLAYLLRDDLEEDIEELKYVLLEDWDHDSKGQGHMTKQDLFDSLFELVDIWTPHAEKDEYVGFFTILESRFQRQSPEKFEKLYYQIIEE